MKLHRFDTVPPADVNENSIRNSTIGLVKRIGELQLRLYAEARHSVLIILQGMDAAGKDGAIKDVFADVNPLGIHVIGFKKPTEHEAAHDFLWRIHVNTPPAGMIHVFNRSHYEDILIPTVEGYLPGKVVARRYDHINDFENMLQDNGTTVLKFFLHVSKKEQQERLEERMTNPTKYWKHKDADWDTRKKWDEYLEVYQSLFDKCNAAPWHIIPSDRNWYKEYLMADIIVKALEKIDPQYPQLVTAMKIPGKS